MILLEELRKIQKRHGYLREADIISLAKKTGIPAADIWSTASFYSFFRTRKGGKHVIRVCNNLPCMANGSKKVLDCLRKELGIRPGNTTRDGVFSLEATSCIGCCDKPPAMMIDGEVFTGLDEKKIKSIIRKARG